MKVTQLVLIVSLFVHISPTVASTPLPTQSTKVRLLVLAVSPLTHPPVCVT